MQLRNVILLGMKNGTIKICIEANARSIFVVVKMFMKGMSVCWSPTMILVYLNVVWNGEIVMLETTFWRTQSRLIFNAIWYRFFIGVVRVFVLLILPHTHSFLHIIFRCSLCLKTDNDGICFLAVTLQQYSAIPYRDMPFFSHANIVSFLYLILDLWEVGELCIWRKWHWLLLLHSEHICWRIFRALLKFFCMR